MMTYDYPHEKQTILFFFFYSCKGRLWKFLWGDFHEKKKSLAHARMAAVIAKVTVSN